QCLDKSDEHYKELKLMEDELKDYAFEYDFKLIPLPMCDAVYFEDERLPATYANFLFVNNAVLVPIYGVKQDKKALSIFEKTFKDRDIVGIDCSTLIKQHGSLHCVSMNFTLPK
ncbi:MAG: agmatine deiminase family protein, partial [Campylobacterales bacterium]